MIDSVVDPLTDDSVDVAEKVTLIRHTGKPMGGSEFHLVITEPHVDSFAGAQLELSFSGIPEDIELVELDAWLTTKKDFDNDDPMTAESGRIKYQSADGNRRRSQDGHCGRRRQGDRVSCGRRIRSLRKKMTNDN